MPRGPFVKSWWELLQGKLRPCVQADKRACAEQIECCSGTPAPGDQRDVSSPRQSTNVLEGLVHCMVVLEGLVQCMVEEKN